jgi:hypothetical protein
MSDYTAWTWVEKTTQVGPTRMNAIEAGLADASTHHKQVQDATSIPAASTANKRHLYQVWTTGELYGNLSALAFERLAHIGGGIRGDGTHGAVNMDGTNTYAAIASKSGSVYTLTNDVYATNFTVGTGVTLNTQGFRIFALGAFTNNGTIQNNGSAGLAAVSGTNARAGGTGGPGVVYAAGQGGGAGGNNAVGVAPAAFTGAHGGSGGAGSAGGANAGGAGGAASAPFGGIRRLASEIMGAVVASYFGSAASQYLAGGAGGGGGGSAVAGTAGGSGGGGGGVVGISCGYFDNSLGTIRANGGDGGASAIANVGRGGGGGGGAIHIIYGDLQSFGTLLVNGGAAGGAGAAAGSAGNIIKVPA